MRMTDFVRVMWLGFVLSWLGCGPSATPDGGPGPGTRTLHILPETLPNAVAGKSYEQALTVSDGVPPLTWKIETTAGSRWLTVDMNGVLRSVSPPTETSEKGELLTLSVKDAEGNEGKRQLSIVITCDSGTTVACFNAHPGKAACFEGESRCVGGKLTACESVGIPRGSADILHCGASCNACDSMMANACVDGKCACGSSAACQPQPGKTMACCGEGGTASCVALNESAKNCGTCGNDCTSPAIVADRQHIAPSCAASQCVLGCSGGFRNCDGVGDTALGLDGNGCETEVVSNLQHCGACNNSCAAQVQNKRNVHPACKTGACAFECRSGFGNCSPGAVVGQGNDADGCETDLTTVQNCGACGRSCSAPANGTPVCTTSGCDFSCAPGFLKCGNACVSQTDERNCGMCGRVCLRQNSPNQWQSCKAPGKCCVKSCFEGDNGKPECEEECF